MIVGAGPVGLVTALLLARYGVASIILERRTGPHPLPRAVHLDDEAVRILQSAGVAEQFARISRPALGLRLLDARHRVMAEFGRSADCGLHGYPQANMFDQPELEALLRDRIAVRPQIELRSGWQLTGLTGIDTDRPVVTALDPRGAVRHLVSMAVLGCDGAASMVRGLIGSQLRDLRFRERWLVVDVRASQDLQSWDGVQQVCDPARAATFMRIGDDRYRFEFRLRDDEAAGSLSEPAVLGGLLRPWTGRNDLTGLDLVRCAEYTFRAQLASDWQRGRVFLLGDAAHQTPPFIGQGLAAGLRDAANLAWKLALVIGGSADEATLRSYQSERAPQAEALIRKAVLLGWAMTGGQDGAARARRMGLAGLVRVPGATTSLLDRGAPAMNPGLLVGRARLAGRLIPQPAVVAGGRLRRLVGVVGAGFSVVSIGPLSPQLTRLSAQLGARVVQLQAFSSSPEVVAEPEQAVIRWLLRARAAAAVIRPDRVVLATADREGRLTGDSLRTVIRSVQLLQPTSSSVSATRLGKGRSNSH